jgi:hypothetical protein
VILPINSKGTIHGRSDQTLPAGRG